MVMNFESFDTMNELIQEMRRIGNYCDIRKEFILNPTQYMLACETEPFTRCEAKLVGIYSARLKKFFIRRSEMFHSCKVDKEPFLLNEMGKDKYRSKRIGEIVTLLYPKCKFSYFDVFKGHPQSKQFAMESAIIEELANENINDKIFKYGISENLQKDLDKENIINDCKYSYSVNIKAATQSSPEFNCLKVLKTEFESLNPHIACLVGEDSFYFRHKDMETILRPIYELKIYSKPNRTIILGLLFDNANEHIVYSCLVSDKPKNEALEFFLDCESQTKEDIQFYIIDIDNAVMGIMKKRNIDYFLKTRAVCGYLTNYREEDNKMLDYFEAINFGELEFLELEKSTYLKKFFKYPLFNLNNSHFPDFEFIGPLSFVIPLIDTVISLIWLISDDIKNRKIFQYEVLENKFPEFIIDILEGYKDSGDDFTVNLEEGYCSCLKFQENLFPCAHAYKKILDLKKDPLVYVSTMYSKDTMLRIKDIVPVVDIKIPIYTLKLMPKKK